MIRLRPALWPTLISLPIFLVSLGLGIWQMERREWKRDILERFATIQAAPPLRKRKARRSMLVSSGLSVGAPCTWQRKPSSA